MRRRQPAAAAAEAPAVIAPHTLIQVTWLDAAFDLDEEPPLYTLRTVGFLIRQDAERLVVASEGDTACRYFRSFTTIPAGWILSILPLQPAG